MIDRYSFLNLEELTEQRRNIKKKKSPKPWEEKWDVVVVGGGSVEGVRDRKASRGEKEVGEHWKRKMTLVVPLEERTEAEAFFN